ncbi:MAG: DUF6789 family protein [Acidimicrobiales bacterium]
MVERKRTETHWPRWLARGALGGLVAGAAFLAVTMWFATSVGDPAKGPLLMMSTIVEGDAAMANGTASAGVGLAVHAVLSAFFGVVFALVASKLRTNGALAVAGPLYGAALYLVNFKIFAPAAFPVLEMANQPFELVVHVVFGTLLSLALFRLPSERQASVHEAHGGSQVPAGARTV